MNKFTTLLGTTLLCLALGSLAWAQPDAAPGSNTGGPARKGAQFTADKLVKLDGTVKGVITPDGAARMQEVQFTLTTATESIEVRLAPAAYLTKIALTLKDGDKVTLNGWKETGHKADFVVASDLTLDGKTFTFRDDKGKTAWNQLIGFAQATQTGKIKDIVTPAAAEGGKKVRQQPVSFTLVTDKESIPVMLDMPAALAQIGFDAKEGDQVTIQGWMRPMKGQAGTLIARTVTVGDKTYTLRDEDGNSATKAAARTKN